MAGLSRSGQTLTLKDTHIITFNHIIFGKC